jgi:hypothetical protein
VLNAANMMVRDVGALTVPTFYRRSDESGEEVFAVGGNFSLRSGSMGNAWQTMMISIVLGVVAIAGYIACCRERFGAADVLVPASVAMIALVPFWTYRYMLPLAPFIFCYLARGLRIAGGWRAARIGLLIMIALNIVDHVGYIAAARAGGDTPSADWLRDARDTDDLFDWMRAHLPHDATVASSNPALVYLRTGMKGVATGGDTRQWNAWRALGIHYVASTRPAALPDSFPDAYRVLYHSPHGLWVIAI